MAIQSHCGDQTTAMHCSSGAQAKNVGSSACWTTAAYLNHPSFKLLLLFASVLNLQLSLSCQLNVWRLSIAIYIWRSRDRKLITFCQKHGSFFPHSLSCLIARVAEAAKAFCTWDLHCLCSPRLLSSVDPANHTSRL